MAQIKSVSYSALLSRYTEERMRLSPPLMSQSDHVFIWVYLIKEKHTVPIYIAMALQSYICYIIKEIIKDASHFVLLEWFFTWNQDSS